MKVTNQTGNHPDLRYTGITIPYVAVCETSRGDRNIVANAIAAKAAMDKAEKQADPPMWFYLSAALVVLGALLPGKGKGR